MQCPACAERIPADTEICPFCKTDVETYEPPVPSRGKSRKGSGKKSGSTISLTIILGACALGLLMCCGILVALLLPAVQQAREAARRTQCKNNLKQIALALHNYHDAYGAFPPAVTYSADGKPMHSWRVLILPFLDQAPMYNMYNLSEPWDSPNNSRLQSMMPQTYACPSSPGGPGTGLTHYAAISGAGTLFPPGKGTRLRDVLDGTSNTIAVGEVSLMGIPWTQPVDIDATNGLTFGPQGLSSNHFGGVNVAMADGAVIFLSSGIAPETLKGLSTVSGGEVNLNY